MYFGSLDLFRGFYLSNYSHSNMKNPINYLSLGLAASTLFLTACGPMSDAGAAAEVTIPDAPDAAMKTIFTELADGNGGVVWQAMPVSYRSDVNTVVRLAGTKIDAEMYDQSFALVGRLGEVINKQKAFILNTSLAALASAEEKAKFEEALPAVTEFIKIIATSNIATSAGLQSFDGQAFCNTTVTEIVKLTDQLSKLNDDPTQPTLGDLRNAEFTVIESDDNSATMTITTAGQPGETEQFTKVEGRWVPADMAAEWTQQMTETKAKLEAMTAEEVSAMKPQVMGVLTMMQGVLTQLETAETQAQFDQALQGAMMPMMGLMMMGQGMGGGAPAMPAPTAP